MSATLSLSSHLVSPGSQLTFHENALASVLEIDVVRVKVAFAGDNHDVRGGAAERHHAGYARGGQFEKGKVARGFPHFCEAIWQVAAHGAGDAAS